MDKVYIKPSPRANPHGEDDKPWQVRVVVDGVDKHTNDKLTRHDAEEAAHKTAVRRGLPFGDKEPVQEAEKDSYMEVEPARGMPPIGSEVIYEPAHINRLRGKVVGHLSEQFIMETAAGGRHVVHVKKSVWEVVE